MKQPSQTTSTLRVSELSLRRPEAFFLSPTDETRDKIAHELGISGIRKLSFRGKLTQGQDCDILLKGELGATVIQPCVVTLDPVITRIDTKVIRRFVSGYMADAIDEETEMPEDDTTEPLRDEIDLFNLMVEALALALPDYPRAENASLENAKVAPPGVAPIEDEDINPFAGLSALRKKL